MSNKLRVEAVPNYADDDKPLPPVEVKITVESENERDISALSDGIDLIGQIAAALRLSVSIGQLEGDLDVAS
jgi:hypothetical protein